MKVVVVDDSDSGAAKSFYAAVDQAVGGAKPSRAAFDCEGVALSRVGSLELVSVTFDGTKRGPTYLVDVTKTSNDVKLQERIDALKKLCECTSVTKVIHDCRMDSDALYHQLGITLQSVHDTSCFHKVITRQESPASLNKALVAHGIEANQTRDSSVYKSNPRFWATRPLTAKMKAWASSDVDKLLELATKQVSILTTKGKTQLQNAFNLSIRSARLLRDMQLERYCYCKIPERQFIGAGGSNIRSVEKRTGTYIRSRSTDKEWLIYYDSNHGLSMAKKAMGY